MNLAEKLSELGVKSASLGQRLAALKGKRQQLAPLALAEDRAALKKLEQLDAEALAIKRESELLSLAVAEAKRLQGEQENEAKRKERAEREQQAKQHATTILNYSRNIDQLMAQLYDMLIRRQEVVQKLFQTKTVSGYSTNRMQQKFPITAAAHAAGLLKFMSLERVLPAHAQKLADTDRWLAGPLTVAPVEPVLDDEAAETQTNGTSHDETQATL